MARAFPRGAAVGFHFGTPASPTIAGVTASRDEVREKALAYLRTGTQ
jgi:hypothetical protein